MYWQEGRGGDRYTKTSACLTNAKLDIKQSGEGVNTHKQSCTSILLRTLTVLMYPLAPYPNDNHYTTR